MLSIQNIFGVEEPFADFTGLRKIRKVNGEKVVSLTIFDSDTNHDAYPLIEEESTIFFNDEEYIIKMMTERSVGKRSIKQIEAVQKFYVDLINKQQHEIHNGSITFHDYMTLVFQDTGYTFQVIDQFFARSFQNLGEESRLGMLQKGLDRFGAEMELNGTQVTFKSRVGDETDFQFRYGHNIKTIERNVDTKNLATVIRGKGDPELDISAYYRSDNADIFGEIDAPTINDERFKSEASLLEEMISRLQDTPEFSITIDFVDLRAAGYPYTVPNEGDSVFVIYEPMQDLKIETRILEIEEEFDVNLKPIKTSVTLANHKKTFAGTLFDNVNKQLDGIITEDGVIRYNVLDSAVKAATEALQSARTELIFENGIVAREEDNPNHLVVFNSKGLGISSDGGQTFREAITADGFVLSAGAIGRLSANHISIGPDAHFEDGYSPEDIKNKVIDEVDFDDSQLREDLRLTAPLPTSIRMNDSGITAWTSNNDGYARLDYRGLYIAGGAIQIDGGLPDSQIENADKWNGQGTYIDENGIYTGTVTAEQVQIGFNEVSDSVRITNSGLETYNGSERTSQLSRTGHRFYDGGAYVGHIGATHIHQNPEQRGLRFNASNDTEYIAWSRYANANSTTADILMSWFKNGTSGGYSEGFSFFDTTRFFRRVHVSQKLYAGSGIFFDVDDVNDSSYIARMRTNLEIRHNNNAISINLHENGAISFTNYGSMTHLFSADGTKIGGSIEIEGTRYGMSPVDSPQVLIEYIEFDVELSRFGTKIMLDETYLKSVVNFAVFLNNGELVSKGKNHIIVKGEGMADIRFVGERIEHDNILWANMQTDEPEEVIEHEPEPAPKITVGRA